jgi:hypothetical protein
MTIITKPLTQQEKDEKQKNVAKSMEDVSLSDSVDVEATKRMYCYTRYVYSWFKVYCYGATMIKSIISYIIKLLY